MTAGYPEALKPEEYERTENGSETVGANSAALFSPDGTYVGGYRKTNLFMTDKTWAKPGNATRLYDPANDSNLGIDRGWLQDIQPSCPSQRVTDTFNRNLYGSEPASAGRLDPCWWAI